MNRKIRAIDLFCGSGGSSLGARAAGVEMIASFDIWDRATKTYSANFPGTKVYNADIRSLSPNEIRREIGDIDLFIASPECTNHSVARGAREPDESSRETVFEVIRFATEFKPQWIVIENVIEMESWSEHSKILDKLWELGYSVRQAKLNSHDFGVPQSRNRLFLLCSLAPSVNFVNPALGDLNPASSIIDRSGKYKMSFLFSDKRALSTITKAKRAISVVGQEEPFLIVYYGSDGAGGWQRLDNPLRTITTLDRFAYVEPGKQGHMMRMLQPEELKLAMGYDKSFNLDIKGINRRDKIKLIGNAVCPPVMKYIVENITR